VKSSLKRAIDLDPDLPEAHAMLSAMFFSVDDMPGMEAEARRALELNPSLPDPYAMLSELAALRGDPAEMVRESETILTGPLNSSLRPLENQRRQPSSETLNEDPAPFQEIDEQDEHKEYRNRFKKRVRLLHSFSHCTSLILRRKKRVRSA